MSTLLNDIICMIDIIISILPLILSEESKGATVNEIKAIDQAGFICQSLFDREKR